MPLNLWGRNELYDEAIYGCLLQTDGLVEALILSMPRSNGEKQKTLDAFHRDSKISKNRCAVIPPTIRRELPKPLLNDKCKGHCSSPFPTAK